MTVRALIMNMAKESVKCELQGRDIDGTFREVREDALDWSRMAEFTLFRGQHLLVIGPATVAVALDYRGVEHRLKVETQTRDAKGRFQEELHAQTVDPMGFHVFSISAGQQLQVHEKMAA